MFNLTLSLPIQLHSDDWLSRHLQLLPDLAGGLSDVILPVVAAHAVLTDVSYFGNRDGVTLSGLIIIKQRVG